MSFFSDRIVFGVTVIRRSALAAVPAVVFAVQTLGSVRTRDISRAVRMSCHCDTPRRFSQQLLQHTFKASSVHTFHTCPLGLFAAKTLGGPFSDRSVTAACLGVSW